MAARKSTKDKAMAADLKRRKVVRTTGRCPICYKLIPNDALNHFRTHA